MRKLALCAVMALSLLASTAEAQQAPRIYRGASPITPGTPVSPGSGVALACSAPGFERLIMDNGSFFDVYATVGTAIIDNIGVSGVSVAGTTATCTVTVLRNN